MLVITTAFVQPHRSLVEETWSRGVPLCFHTATVPAVRVSLLALVQKRARTPRMCSSLDSFWTWNKKPFK